MPELGVGLVFAPGMEPLLDAGREAFDLLEVEPQTLWAPSGQAERPFRLNPAALELLDGFPQAKILHGVGHPVGGTVAPDQDALDAFLETLRHTRSPWVSEHLSFNRARSGERVWEAGFLLPPVASWESVELAARNIRVWQERLSVPFAFETGVSYLQPLPGEMSDGAFFAAVAERADCGILLDLHNLWANQSNGRATVEEVMSELPLERVWEVHLAGGERRHGYWLDAHSGLVPEELWPVAAQVVKRLPRLKAVVFEIMPEAALWNDIPAAAFLDLAGRMRELWDLRGRERRPPARAGRPSGWVRGAAGGSDLPAPELWEESLACLINGYELPDSPVAERLKNDPSVPLLRDLIESVRSGILVTALRLTCRYLILELGMGSFRELMRDFWRMSPPHLFPSQEAQSFREFLRGRFLSLPHVYEVLDFELAGHRATIHGASETVAFSAEPLALLADLGAGRRPQPAPGAARYEVTVTPD